VERDLKRYLLLRGHGARQLHFHNGSVLSIVVIRMDKAEFPRQVAHAHHFKRFDHVFAELLVLPLRADFDVTIAAFVAFAGKSGLRLERIQIQMERRRPAAGPCSSST